MDTEIATVPKVENFHVLRPAKLQEVLKQGLSPNIHSIL